MEAVVYEDLKQVSSNMIKDICGVSHSEDGNRQIYSIKYITACLEINLPIRARIEKGKMDSCVVPQSIVLHEDSVPDRLWVYKLNKPSKYKLSRCTSEDFNRGLLNMSNTMWNTLVNSDYFNVYKITNKDNELLCIFVLIPTLMFIEGIGKVLSNQIMSIYSTQNINKEITDTLFEVSEKVGCKYVNMWLYPNQQDNLVFGTYHKIVGKEKI